MRNNSVKLFLIKPVAQEEMSFKDISYLELWQPFAWQCRSICAIFVEGTLRNNSMR